MILLWAERLMPTYTLPQMIVSSRSLAVIQSRKDILKAPHVAFRDALTGVFSGSIIAGFEDAAARSLSILYQHGAPLTIIDVSIAGGEYTLMHLE